MDARFPLAGTDQNSNMAESKESLRLYLQTLMEGFRAAARRLTNLTKVSKIRQGKNESPTVFLERVMEAYRTYIRPWTQKNQKINLQSCLPL